jgi:hypothetical protein
MSLTTPQLIDKIQRALCPTLLKRGYGQSGHWLAGHCYIAAEALYHLLPDKEDWRPMTGRDQTGCSHWWLQHKKTCEVLDPTEDQYYDMGKFPPYMEGHACGFLTKAPCKRTKRLYMRMNLQCL